MLYNWELYIYSSILYSYIVIKTKALKKSYTVIQYTYCEKDLHHFENQQILFKSLERFLPINHRKEYRFHVKKYYISRSFRSSANDITDKIRKTNIHCQNYLRREFIKSTDIIAVKLSMYYLTATDFECHRYRFVNF